MYVVIEFSGRSRGFPLSLGADHGKKEFFLSQVVEPVLVKADQFGLNAVFFGLRRKSRSQSLGIACLRSISYGNLSALGYCGHWFLCFLLMSDDTGQVSVEPDQFLFTGTLYEVMNYFKFVRCQHNNQIFKVAPPPFQARAEAWLLSATGLK